MIGQNFAKLENNVATFRRVINLAKLFPIYHLTKSWQISIPNF